MKITYTQAIQELIASFETVPFDSDWDRRNAVSSIHTGFVKALPEVIKTRDSTNHLCKYSWEKAAFDFKQTRVDGKTVIDHETVFFTISRAFESKKELQTWLATNGFKLPRKSKKTSDMYNDKPHVIYNYTITQDDFVLNVSYRKEGLPSTNCYVQEEVSTYKSIVCNLK